MRIVRTKADFGLRTGQRLVISKFSNQTKVVRTVTVFWPSSSLISKAKIKFI